MRLRELRENKKLSQAALGKLFQAAQNTISNWEQGTREIPQETLIKLADFFDVTVDYLLGRTDNPEPPLTEQDEFWELRDELHKRPEMRMLFKTSKGATKEDILKAVKIIEALRDDDFSE